MTITIPDNALPWDPTKDHYEGGEEVTEQGGLFQAKYWTQADPLSGSSDWATLSPVINTPAAPAAPVALHTLFTSSDVVNLGWNPAYVPGIGTVTKYDVFENGVKIGSTSSTDFHVSGLQASTSYNFTVDAVDGTGTGPQSAPLAVTTTAPTISSGQYFSPYVDLSLSAASTNLAAISPQSGITSFTLAFIQNSGVDATTHIPTIGWGGSTSVGGPITNDGGITAEVHAMQMAGGTITIAFGGQTGTDPATAADTYYNYLITTGGQSTTAAFTQAAAMLQAQYQSVMDHYGVSNLDFDIEGATAVDDVNGDHLRDAAIKNLEAANPNLKVSFTLPTGSSGLLTSGFNGNVLRLLTFAAQDHVRVDVVNIMAMDYYDSDDATVSMAAKAESAANAVHQQVIAAGLSSKIGITPMVGLNDDVNETFSLADAQTLESWAALPAQHTWIAGFGIWSIARDHGVAEDLNNPGHPIHEGAPEPTNSGLLQTDYQFSSILNQITAGTPAPPTGQTFIGVAGTNTFAGTAAGNDTVDYHQHATGGVTVDLKVTTAQAIGGGMGNDTLTSIENVLGSSFGDHLNGNSSANMLTGNEGADFLNGRGGTGIDVLTGGAGNDTYYVHNVQDQVIEGAGDALDKVYVVGTSYTLAANAQVEYLYADNGATGVTLVGNSYSHHIIGSAGIDHLTGGDGDDLLNGNAGADFMTGGKGNDSYYVNDTNEHITELAGAAEGTADKAYISASSYTLASDAHVEYLYANVSTGVAITGNAFTTHIVGGAGIDHLTGGSGSEFINGGKGNDIITGGGGGDTLTGGAGDDHFVFNSIADSAKAAGQYDTITDFTHGAGATGDKIDLTAIDASTAAGTQSFHFIGSAAFAAAGDLRAVANANGSTTITGDVNGDHVADFQIVLLAQTGHPALAANDFLGVHV